jgi:hypothetical protein
MEPGKADFLYSFGITLLRCQCRYEEAAEQFDGALKIRPGCLDDVERESYEYDRSQLH